MVFLDRHYSPVTSDVSILIMSIKHRLMAKFISFHNPWVNSQGEFMETVIRQGGATINIF
jgi:hypothetical protein